MKRVALSIVGAGAACMLLAASTAKQPASAPARPAPAPPALSFEKVLYVSTGTIKHTDTPAPGTTNAPATAVRATSPADPAKQTPPRARRKRGAAAIRYLDVDGDGVADLRDL
ncbi:MAG: hypothetical protein NTV22_03015 [bacterium]|nr:hypothetical protein [bacterium]